MYKILLLCLSFWQTSIYSIGYTAVDGSSQSFNNCQGKKILIVNIATSSSRVSQIAGLEQLNQLYKDSLVIIAFPSNAFGNEQRTDAEIKTFCETNYNSTFQIAQKGIVTGAEMQPIYAWLANISQNEVMNAPVVADFQKFLIDKNGSIIGVFGATIEPMDSILVTAITE